MHCPGFARQTIICSINTSKQFLKFIFWRWIAFTLVISSISSMETVLKLILRFSILAEIEFKKGGNPKCRKRQILSNLALGVTFAYFAVFGLFGWLFAWNGSDVGNLSHFWYCSNESPCLLWSVHSSHLHSDRKELSSSEMHYPTNLWPPMNV